MSIQYCLEWLQHQMTYHLATVASTYLVGIASTIFEGFLNWFVDVSARVEDSFLNDDEVNPDWQRWIRDDDVRKGMLRDYCGQRKIGGTMF